MHLTRKSIRYFILSTFLSAISSVALADEIMDPSNQAELQVKAFYDQVPSNSVEGGTSYGTDSTAYSPTFNNNWRLFAEEYISHEDEPFGEGNITLWRTAAGLEYHDTDFKASLAPTYNYYDNEVGYNNRVGGVGNVSWAINNQWTVGSNAQLFSADTPLRALNEGITANSYDVNVGWHQGDTRSMILDESVMTYSDDNVHAATNGTYTERLYTGSKFYLNGILNAVTSQSSLNEDRPYFNPKLDLLSSAGLQATEQLYRDGSTVYLQSLQVLPGDYWQENYGNDFALNARYELRAHFNDNFETGIGASYSRQAYDGSEQNDYAVLFDLAWRL